MRPVAALSEIHDVSQPISRQADLPTAGFVATIPPLADPRGATGYHDCSPGAARAAVEDSVAVAAAIAGRLGRNSSRALIPEQAASGESQGW
jgi:hypothetical protein